MSKFVSSVALVGLPNAGKSTLLNALVGIKIAPITKKPQTTRKIIRGIITEGDHQIIFFDTPGLPKKDSALHKYMTKQIFLTLEDVHQIAIIVDVTQDSQKNFDFIKKITSKKPTLLILNKIDRLKNKDAILEKIKEYSKVKEFNSIIPISAKNVDGLSVLIEEIKKLAQPSEFLFDSELFTDATEREIVAELIRAKAMEQLMEELPYKIAVTIEEFDESRRNDEKKPLIKIAATLHVERPTQKAIVIGNKGETIKSIGTKARKDIELLLQCQVMLELFVRVEPDWTSSATSLKKLGY